MNVQPLDVTREQASAMLLEYKAHRNTYDKRDWEIERIYRTIAHGKTVISVQDAIVKAGTDALARPLLAICRADSIHCTFQISNPVANYTPSEQKHCGPVSGKVSIDWPTFPPHRWWFLEAQLPRIPPQHRPPADKLANYHILWEADWTDIPHDPYLLRRIGKDAWLVLAAWNLTSVEMNVLRAHNRTT
jgi:hypothetical protein